MNAKKWKSLSVRRAGRKILKICAAAGYGIFAASWLAAALWLGYFLAKSGSPLIFCAFAAAKPSSATYLLNEVEQPPEEALSTPEDEQEKEPAKEPPEESQSDSSADEPEAYVPLKERGEIDEIKYSAAEGGIYLDCGGGILKNCTKLSSKEIKAMLKTSCKIKLSTDGKNPQVLVYHTHATEGYEAEDNGWFNLNESWRSTDRTKNMYAVGEAFCSVLNESGIATLHDGTLHDDPSYKGSYERSATTIKKYLSENKDIKICIDLHRDALEPAQNRIIKPTTVIDGKKAAQIMIIAGCDDGSMNMPDYAENLRLAAAIQNKAEELYPGLMRPILFDYRRYNMNLSGGLLLIEIGATGNTLDEAKYSAELLAEVLKSCFLE